MTTTEALIAKRLTNLVTTFPEVTARYKYDDTYNTHVIKVEPSAVYHTNEQFRETISDLLIEFIEECPVEGFVFLPEDDQEYQISGKYQKFTNKSLYTDDPTIYIAQWQGLNKVKIQKHIIPDVQYNLFGSFDAKLDSSIANLNIEENSPWLQISDFNFNQSANSLYQHYISQLDQMIDTFEVKGAETEEKTAIAGKNNYALAA